MRATSVCLFGERGHGVKRAFFEITNQCNMSCKHCMNNSGSDFQRPLTKEEVKQLCRELTIHKIKHLYISGGEPLLYDGIDEVLQYAHSIGIKIVLATNGQEIENHISTIKNCVEAVSVSLDGIGKTHDFFRGVPGAFKQLTRMLDILKLEKIPAKMSTIIWKENRNELTDIIYFAKSKGILKLNFNIMVLEGRAKANPEIHIPGNEYKCLYEKVNELIEKHSDDSFKIDMKRRYPIDSGSQSCPGGETMFHINSLGKVSPCSWLSKIDDTNEFSSFWTQNSLGNCLEKCKKIDTILEERKSIYGYSGCPALAKIQNGGYFSEDPINRTLEFI